MKGFFFLLFINYLLASIFFQDILSCGFTGALYSGILTASAVLKRNAMIDLVKLHKKLKANEKSKIE
jgi:hypothetical protein